jgi:hypothetical protein
LGQDDAFYEAMSALETNHAKPLSIALLIAAIVYVINFGLLGFLIGPFDYNHLSGYYELAWRFWRTAPGLPEYNPFLCGGRTLGGDPQLPIFHPLILLVPILGPTWVIKLEMLAQITLGGLALWYWLPQLGAKPPGRLWGTFAFVTGGAVVTRFLVGHVTLGFYFLTPAFFYLSYQLVENPRRSRVWAMYLGLFAYCGLYKPNFIIYFLPPLMIEHAARALLTKRPGVLLRGLAASFFCLAITAVSWWPAFRYFSDHPRADAVPFNGTPLYALFVNLLMPLKGIPYTFYGALSWMPRHEYNLFIGPLGVVLAGIGLYRVYRSSATPHRSALTALLVFSVISAWMGMGFPGASVHSEFQQKLFKLWPGFNSIRIPPRFWFGVYLSAIVFSALGWWLPARAVYRRVWLFVLIVPVLGSASVNLFKTSLQAHETQWTQSRIYREPVFWKTSEPDGSFQDLRQGYGILRCVYNLETFQPDTLTEGHAFLIATPEPVRFHGEFRGWNRIVFEATGDSAPFTFSLNLNHSDYWTLRAEGARITSHLKERLTIQSARPTIRGELEYRQPGVPRALAISAIAALLFLGWLALALGKGWLRE